MNADTLFAWGCQRYPAAPGFKARQTSRDAAAAMRGHSRQLQARVLAALRERSMTADETAAAIGESLLSVRPRCTELFRLGQVADSGERRRNRSGRMATVWRVSE